MNSKRFTLARTFSQVQGPPPLLWIDFNPGPANDVHDDPQTERMMDMSFGWGYPGIRVVSLFPERGDEPHFCRDTTNERALWAAFELHSEAIACWGNAAPKPWSLYIRQQAASNDCSLWCLGFTSRGAPRHPLPLPVGTPRERYTL